jgi:uncharacterized protein (TIGR02996 family)
MYLHPTHVLRPSGVLDSALVCGGCGETDEWGSRLHLPCPAVSRNPASAFDDPAFRGLMEDILHHPADDFPRLVMADWLEDHGQEDRAAFIRLQIEAEDPRVQEDNVRWEQNEARQRLLMYSLQYPWPGYGHGEPERAYRKIPAFDAWSGAVGNSVHVTTGPESYRRGFIETVTPSGSDRTILAGLPPMVASQPIRRLLGLGRLAAGGILDCVRIGGRLWEACGTLAEAYGAHAISDSSVWFPDAATAGECLSVALLSLAWADAVAQGLVRSAAVVGGG